MKIIDCPWELANLDCRVVEIRVAADEVIDKIQIQELESKYDYLVLKVQAGAMKNNIVAAELGFELAETQMFLLKAKRDWHMDQDLLTSRLMQQLSVERITMEEDFEELMSLITEDMYSTDRIYLDPEFGPKYSERRYKNWTRTEWERGALLYKHYFRGKYVGYSLCKKQGDELVCLLAGCFEQYQKTGIGLWIPLVPELYPDMEYSRYTTHVSTNNIPVWQTYNRQKYEVGGFDYVFVKHIHH